MCAWVNNQVEYNRFKASMSSLNNNFVNMIAGENQPAKGHESSNGNEVLGGEELAERTETANGDDDGEGEQAEGMS